jgi:phage protein U
MYDVTMERCVGTYSSDDNMELEDCESPASTAQQWTLINTNGCCEGLFGITEAAHYKWPAGEPC